jgi:hypothetical protein
MTSVATRGIAFAVALLAAASAVDAQERAFDFGLIGDMPYSRIQEQQYGRVLDELNRTELAFVIHVGDMQADPRLYNRDPSAASKPCVEENLKALLGSFQGLRHPFILTPGDNDWTDCVHMKEPKVDPLASLAMVRAMFYPEGRSLGQRSIAVESQSKDAQYSKFRENLRWSMGGVAFVTLHIVGSNDNFGRAPEMDAESLERRAANLAWMRSAFAKAKADDSRGIVLMTQANPGFENYWPADPRGRYFGPFFGRGKTPPAPSSAFDEYIAALAVELEGYDKPVIFLHGDTHLFRHDKPLYSKQSSRVFANFTRVETFGWPDSHWVRITVDPADPQLFRVKAEIVPGNIAHGKK